jgi:hypothetical protein
VASSDEVRLAALDLARRGEETDAAVDELLALCGDRRVAVVVARQALTGDNDPDATVSRAMELLDAVLERGGWG